jgi:hypothetical protein
MYVRGGPRFIQPFHGEFQDLLCFPFLLIVCQSYSSDGDQDYPHDVLMAVAWFHEVVAQVTYCLTVP